MTDTPRLFFAVVIVAVATISTVGWAEPQCERASLNGNFGFAGTGLIPEQSQNGTARYDPVSHVGIVNYDGQGKVTVAMRVQYHQGTAPLKFDGSYDIQADCTGVATFKDSGGAIQLVWNFVIVHSKEEIETIAIRAPSTSRPSYSLVFTQKKQ